MHLDCGYRIDLVIDERLSVEIRAIDGVLPIHVAQVLTYLRLSGLRHGLIVNFNRPRLKDGLKSILLTDPPAPSFSSPSSSTPSSRPL